MLTESAAAGRSARGRGERAQQLALGGLAFVLALVVFTRMTAPGVTADILQHAAIARAEWAHGRWFTYSAWYLVLLFVSVRGTLIGLRAASVLALALAVAAKAVAARSAVRRSGGSALASTAIGAALVVATPLLLLGHAAPNGARIGGPLRGAIYLGQLSATLWHNSTSVASMPLVLSTAMAARTAIDRLDRRSIAVTSAWFAASALMKPNYAMAALPVVAVAVLVRSVRRCDAQRTVAHVALLGVPTAVVLAVELALVRTDPNIVHVALTWDPLTLWRHYAASPPVAVLVSVAFPVVGTIAARVATGSFDRWVRVSWAVLVVAVAQLALLGERSRDTAQTTFDGNWFWGAHAAVLVLFVAVAAAVGKASADRGRDAPRAVRLAVAIAWVVLAFHVASGVVYLARLMQYGDGFRS